MRTGFSRWASYAYATKLKQKRKITGDMTTKLEGREQAYAEQGSGPEGSKQATAVQARLAAAWTYHKQSYAQAGKAEPMVKAWKQTHTSTEVSKAKSGGTGAGHTAGEAVTVEQKPSPPVQREGKSKNTSNPGDDSPDDSSTENSGDESSSGGERDEKRSKPSRKLWRCTRRMKSSGSKKKKSPLPRMERSVTQAMQAMPRDEPRPGCGQRAG
jgi:hypothetical protein